MSRDLSINKIAPHLTASFVQGVEKAEAMPSFSPYVARAGGQPKDEGGGESQAKQGKSNRGEGSKLENSYPDIFKLIAVPGFSELLALSMGEDSSQLMYIVKNMRKQRGVTNFIPVSEAKNPGPKETFTYLKTDTFFSASRGRQFTGRM